MAFVTMNFYYFSHIWKVEGSSFKFTIRKEVSVQFEFMYADDKSFSYPYKYEDAVKPYIDRDVALIVEYM